MDCVFNVQFQSETVSVSIVDARSIGLLPKATADAFNNKIPILAGQDGLDEGRRFMMIINVINK